MTDNTPLNADDELVTKIANELGYGDFLSIKRAAIKQLLLADRKKHELQAQLNYIEYLDQIPSNELMDWKGLLADSRKLIKQEIEEL